MKHLLLLSLALVALPLESGQTVGTLLNTELAFDGYTLVDPMGTGNTHLINNCGEVINTWTSDFNAGGACYLLEDGSLARGCKVSGAFGGGGVGGRLDRKNRDDELIWAQDWANDERHHHHDFAWMPNGHVLVLAWELKTNEEAAAAGRVNPQLMWPESITEIAPEGSEGGTVVWEYCPGPPRAKRGCLASPFWRAGDHPHRLDVFCECGRRGRSRQCEQRRLDARQCGPTTQPWTKSRSAPGASMVWIIDHGTTTDEAAGPAGDLLYRYGNPEAYGRGDAEDQVFLDNTCSGFPRTSPGRCTGDLQQRGGPAGL